MAPKHVDHLVSEHDRQLVPWQLDGNDLADVVDHFITADARLHALGRRIDDETLARTADALGCTVAGDPSEATHVIVADTPRSIEERVEAMRLHIDPDVQVITIDFSLANWPARQREERAWLYRPGDTTTWGRFLERHLVAIFSRDLDGFIIARFNAYVDLGTPAFEVSDSLRPLITCHHLGDPIHAGQRRQVDIEIHPGNVPRRGVTGTISVTADGRPTGIEQEFTLATSRFADCILSGRDEGPIRGERLDRLVRRMRQGILPSAVAARRIQRASRRTGIEP